METLDTDWGKTPEIELLDNTPRRKNLIERINFVCENCFKLTLSLTTKQINYIILYLEANKTILDNEKLVKIITQVVEFGYIESIEYTTEPVRTIVDDLILPGKTEKGKYTYL